MLKYLQQTFKFGLMYKGNINLSNLSVKTYSDASFAGDRDERKSTNGWLVQISGASVIWISNG